MLLFPDLKELMQEQGGDGLTTTHREVLRHNSQDAISKTQTIFTVHLAMISITLQAVAQIVHPKFKYITGLLF